MGVLVEGQCIEATQHAFNVRDAQLQHVIDNGFPNSILHNVGIGMWTGDTLNLSVKVKKIDSSNVYHGLDESVTYLHDIEQCDISSGTTSGGEVLINYTDSAAFWSFAFVSIMTLWLVAHSAGRILAAVKKF